MVFAFEVEKSNLATIYKDSEPENAPRVCFKYFFDRKCVKPLVLLLWGNCEHMYVVRLFVNTFVSHFVRIFVICL